MSLVSSRSNKKLFQSKGFGLIELMVSISIMAFIMAVVFAKQDSFNGTILLRSQAYDVALQIREIQLYAVSAATIKGDYRTLLGVTFDTDASPNLYQIAQHTLDSSEDIDSTTPFGVQGIIDNRFEISAVEAVGSSYTGDSVTIMFERPDFDARFFDDTGNEILDASNVEVDIRRIDSGDIRTIEVTRTGQIRVQS